MREVLNALTSPSLYLEVTRHQGFDCHWIHMYVPIAISENFSVQGLIILHPLTTIITFYENEK